MYDILKKHETLINHYHAAQSLGNGWGAQLQEIQTVIPANLNCGVCIGDMLNTAYHMLQRMEKERAIAKGIAEDLQRFSNDLKKHGLTEESTDFTTTPEGAISIPSLPIMAEVTENKVIINIDTTKTYVEKGREKPKASVPKKRGNPNFGKK